jgi:hypothetical protein
VVWLGIAAMLAVVPVGLISALILLHWPEWLVTSSLIGYCAAIWYVGNRV